MTRAILGLGSNLGDRIANLRAAVALLEERGCQVTACSSVWETAPVPADQPPFLNAVIAIDMDLAPTVLLALAKEVEYTLGRRPARRWGPRPADIDILFYADLRLDDPALTIPHPRIAERNFVLAPLAEITPDPLPTLRVTAAELLSHVGTAGATRTTLSLKD